jgi:hypothetical protein
MLDDAIVQFSSKHPMVRVNKLSLWGYGFGKVAHVLVETSDDKAVFGGRHGEYNDNEITRGVRFDWWPDFYACAENEPYEIHMPDGQVVKTFQSQEGNDAIDRPFFGLLMEVLKEADLHLLNKGKPFILGVEMGSSGLQETWE